MAVLALFPGSFDPFTKGHEAILRRILPLFDKVVVAVGVNTEKQYMFSVEERMELIREAMKDCPTVEVTSYSGMTIDLCHQLGAKVIIMEKESRILPREDEETSACLTEYFTQKLGVLIITNAEVVAVQQDKVSKQVKIALNKLKK